MKAAVNPKSKTYAWYQRFDTDGSIYFTPQRRFRNDIIICGPGNRPPTPSEIAKAMIENPDADTRASGFILVNEDEQDTNEVSCDLPSGFYNYSKGTYNRPSHLHPMEMRHDRYYRSPGLYEQITQDVRSFLKSEEIYRRLGFQYRRGILFYGSPGNGKTSLIRELLNNEVPKDAVVIFLDRIPQKKFSMALQATLRDRMKVLVFEELASTITNSSLDEILNFLDGEDSLDRCLILATTNYPSHLPGNIVDRPSRFDRIYRFGDPDKDLRYDLLSHFLGRTPSDSEIEATSGLSTAGIREISLLFYTQGISVEQAAKVLRQYRHLAKKEFGEIGTVGIRGASSDDD